MKTAPYYDKVNSKYVGYQWHHPWDKKQIFIYTDKTILFCEVKWYIYLVTFGSSMTAKKVNDQSFFQTGSMTYTRVSWTDHVATKLYTRLLLQDKIIRYCVSTWILHSVIIFLFNLPLAWYFMSNSASVSIEAEDAYPTDAPAPCSQSLGNPGCSFTFVSLCVSFFGNFMFFVVCAYFLV